MSDAEPSATGWNAITSALGAVYGGVEPLHRAPIPGPAFGGGVQGISAYPAAGHWHLVTYGLSELYDKQSDDPSRSGWGNELAIRVGPRGDDAPTWAFNLLERIAQETRRAGTVFSVGHRLDSGGPIDGGSSPFTALAFTVDPDLGAIETPNGRVESLLVVGITGAELAEMRATSTEHVLDRIASRDSKLVTDPSR